MRAAIRLCELRIGAFRGLVQAPPIDLRAPITLVYAANGTGKTTLCEAIEWLLTGQVERLKEGGSFDADAIRPIFSDADPHVSATLTFNGADRVLARSLTHISYGASAKKAHDIIQNDLLAELAPGLVGPNVHHRTAIPLRQSWLRGTRFLSAEALSALVDTDPQTLDRRRQIFADVLGIAPYLEAEDRLKRYAAQLEKPARDLTAQINEAEARLLSLKEGQAASMERRTAEELTVTAERILGLGPSDTTKVDDRLQRLLTVVMTSRSALARRSQLISFIARNWSRADELGRLLQEHSEQETQLAASVAATEKAQTEREATRESLQARSDELSRTLESVAAWQIKLSSDLQRLSSISEDVSDRSVDDLVAQLPASQWPASARESRSLAIRTLRTRLSEIEDLQVHRKETEAALSALSGGFPEDVQRAEAALATATAQRNASEQAMIEVGGPIDRLRGAAREFLAHDHSQSECPVCNYDWGSFDKLKSAIERVLDTEPSHLAEISTALATANAEFGSKTHALQQARQLSTQRATLLADVASCTVQIEAFERDVASLALSSSSPNIRDDLRLEEIRAALADATAELLQTLREKPHHVSSEFNRHIPLKLARGELERNLAPQVRQSSDELAAVAAQLEATRDLLQTSTVQLNSARQQLATTRALIERESVEQAEFLRAWTELEPAEARTLGRLDSITQADAADDARLRSAETAVAAARSAAEFEKTEKLIEAQERQLADLRQRQTAIDEKKALAERTASAVRSFYIQRSEEQLRQLDRVVNPLFARMHANRVFDRISLGSGEDVLHWLAEAGSGRIVDPQKGFSHGQRQDLALALFLSRARSLGGTFFLDEPVSHLDDLNRVGLLDALRATAIQGGQSTSFVITSASRMLTRHMIEKFSRVSDVDQSPTLRVLELEGNPRTGITFRDAYPGPS